MLCICYTFIAQFIEPYEYRGIEIDASFSTAVYNLSEAVLLVVPDTTDTKLSHRTGCKQMYYLWRKEIL